MFIVFLGVDGSGKTTLINSTIEWAEKQMPGKVINYFHFCAVNYYNKGNNSIVDKPHGKNAYNYTISLLKDIFIVWKFYKSSIRIKKLISSGHLVIVDRYYYDLLIDSKRYRMPDFTFRSWIAKKVYSPSLVFACIGDAESIYLRKKEISVLEIQQQQRKIDKLRFSLKSSKSKWVVIDTTKNDVNASLELILKNLI